MAARGDTNLRYFQYEKIKFLSPRGHVMFCYFIYTDEISNEPATRLSGKLSCNWLIMLVTMATPISSHNSIFTARDEGMMF